MGLALYFFVKEAFPLFSLFYAVCLGALVWWDGRKRRFFAFPAA
jgi:hypothetical protein